MNKVTLTSILKKKETGQKISMLTAYDYISAQLLDQSGIDIILVGDSLGNVVLGYEDTIPVTMTELLHHTKAVARGVRNSFVIADLPFLSYQVSVEEAIRNAEQCLKEGGARAVKLEGASPRIIKVIKALVEIGIPVMGHLGFTPQAVNQLGGYKVQGKAENAAVKISEEAKLLQAAGAFSIVLEMVPAKLAEKITEELDIPVISCGGGAACDGQVLVLNDILGLSDKAPKFAKQYLDLKKEITKAVSAYKQDVEQGKFPTKDHSF
jgi:3-methyl-2-oxobutanoate hydroxymethyltransferase